MARLENIDYLNDWLAVRRRKEQQDMRLHDHPLTELVMVTAGRSKHLLDEDAFPIQAGDVFVIPPGLRHGYAETDGLRLVNILFDLDGLGVPRLDLEGLPGYHALFTFEPKLRHEKQFGARLRLSLARIAEIDEMAAGIEREVLDPRPGSVFAAASHLMQVILALSREYSEQQEEDPLAMLRLGKVLTYIEAHSAEALTVERLAQLARMSERSLFRAFRTALGCSPIEHTLEIRLRHASELLRSTDLGLDQIAARTGFADGGYLSRQFRRRYRIPPTEYRRRIRTASTE